MEHNNSREDLLETPQTQLSGSEPEQLSGDERAVQLGIAQARAEDREVDDAVARVIAAGLHGGQNTALYSLASSGNLSDERLDAELHELYQDPDPQISEWASALGTYVLHREHRGPVDGWARLWPEPPEQPPTDRDDEAEARAELMRRITAGGAMTLGQVATIYTADGVYGRDVATSEAAEIDDMPWTDAAHWRAGSDDDEELTDSTGQRRMHLEALFAEPTVDSFGSREEMVWGGLVWREGQAGGAILLENSYGQRSAWTTDSDEELAVRWHDLREEHEAYKLACEAAETDGDDSSPAIWVASLADYTAGYLHGAWLNAALTPEELTPAIQLVLRNSHEPDAEEYGIFDYEGFGSEVTGQLGEYPSLKTVTKVAQGIAEHGQAYAAWATYVGLESDEQLDRFEDHYLGEWESIEAYAEELLQETEAYRVIEEAPEGIRPYLQIDVAGYARDLEYDLHTVEKQDGGVWVFDTRT